MIGRRCKGGNTLSRPVLIARALSRIEHSKARARAMQLLRCVPRPGGFAAAPDSVRSRLAHGPFSWAPPGVAGKLNIGRAAEGRSILWDFRGGYTGGETPGSIPNPVVKPARADGTAPARAWESRSPPRAFLFLPSRAAGRGPCGSGVRSRHVPNSSGTRPRLLAGCASITDVARAFWVLHRWAPAPGGAIPQVHPLRRSCR